MQHPTATQPPARSPLVFWRVVAGIISEHIFSQRILAEWGSAILVALFILRDSSHSNAMLGVWALYAIAISLYTTSVLADNAEQPYNVQRLLALSSRRTFIWAYLVSANLIVYTCQIILVAASFVLAPLARPDLVQIAMTIPSIVLIIGVATACMLLLTPLVSTVVQRIVLMLVIALPVIWSTLAAQLFTPESATIKSALDAVFGIMLWPSLHLYASAVTPSFDRTTLVVFAINGTISLILAAIATVRFQHKYLSNS